MRPPRTHWLDSLPVTLNLPREDFVCPPGDPVDAALFIRDRLRDYLDTNSSKLDKLERQWLYRVIDMWTRRAESPSDWYLLHGDEPIGQRALGLDFRTERCLLRVDEVLRHYEGRGGPAPREIARQEQERRERARAAGRETRRRRKERAERQERESRAEMDGLSVDERERIMGKILARVGAKNNFEKRLDNAKGLA